MLCICILVIHAQVIKGLISASIVYFALNLINFLFWELQIPTYPVMHPNFLFTKANVDVFQKESFSPKSRALFQGTWGKCYRCCCPDLGGLGCILQLIKIPGCQQRHTFLDRQIYILWNKGTESKMCAVEVFGICSENIPWSEKPRLQKNVCGITGIQSFGEDVWGDAF